MEELMNYAAIMHRTTDEFCYAIDTDTIEINIRTAYDIEAVALYYNDPFSGGILGGDWTWRGEREVFTEMKELPNHKVWTIHIQPLYKRVKYYFELCTKDEKILYFEDGFFTQQAIDESHKKLQCFTFPWLHPADINTVPKWVNETIWYQIFPDRFCNGDLSIDASNGKLWGESQPKNEDTYNGDLRGIINKLDYLSTLGITGMYLTPIFTSPSNHKYDTTNYFEIDPLFGDKETFHELVQKAHEKGIRIMLDGVFNHCGRYFDKWMDVLEKGPESIYYDWFMIEQWPFDKTNPSTEGKPFYSFAFTSNMPKLNTSNPEVMDYVCGVCEYWIKEFDIDGWRLDVANEISHAFCKYLRRRLRACKSDIFILGEIWHDAMPWLRGDEFDSVMNYPLTSAIDDFWMQKTQSKKQFERQYNQCYHRYMKQTNDVLFNLMDSHDTDRLLHRVKGNKDIFYQQLLIMFTSAGTTCIFYGTELALNGSYDPDCRACMPWEDMGKNKFDEEFTTLQHLISLRKRYPASRTQHIMFLDEYDNERVLVYKKIVDDEGLKVTINASQVDITVHTSHVVFERLLTNSTLHAGGCMVEMIKE